MRKKRQSRKRATTAAISEPPPPWWEPLSNAVITRAFERSGAQRRFHTRPSHEPWRESPNDFAKWLMMAFVATTEPVFLEAFRLLIEYGCADKGRNPAKRLKALGTLLAMDSALRGVDDELHRQDAERTRRSPRRAMLTVISCEWRHPTRRPRGNGWRTQWIEALPNIVT